MTTIATLDFDRQARRGFPEAVLCTGKTRAQVSQIASLWRERASSEPLGPLLFTRTDEDHVAGILSELPDAAVHGEARLVAWPPAPPTPSGGQVVVVCAGTADLPYAREAALTASYLGRPVKEIVDVGVAGLHRILAQRATLEEADVIVVAAGMDGALVPVVAGLARCPVVALPTSIGYGAGFNGLAALLSMLNSCAPGVGVVNIDNGYGAGHLAAQIAAGRDRHA